jgi:2-dehydropantoate 2-reductase
LRIVIIGTGAMGSVYAALLAGKGGHDVVAIDRWQAHVDRINAAGLRVEGCSGDRTVRMRAATGPAGIAAADLVVIATKDDGVEEAAGTALALARPEAPILTIQNGLGSADKVAAIAGRERVMVGVVGGFGASIRAPGHAHHNGMEFVRLGEMEGGLTPRLETIAQAWRAGGFTVLTFADIHKMVWEKLICNCAYSAPCALTGLTIGEVQANADAWSIASACASEAYQVARAKGIKLDFTDPVAYVRTFGTRIPNARPSMLLDHLAGRRSEIDNINGAIPREGRPVGVPAPVNATLVALVRAREQAFSPARKG